MRPAGPPAPPAPPVAMGPRAPPAPPGGDKAAWDAKLNADSAGMADNAEDFTKQFMSQLMGGPPGPPGPPAPPITPAGVAPRGPPAPPPRPQGPPGGGDKAAWEAKLNADSAGMADNAEDFTKQFMAQLMGG